MLLTWAFLSLAFSQCSRNFLVNSTTFEIKSYSRCWLTLFGVSIVFKIIGIWILIFTLGNHRANEKQFSNLPNLLIYSSVIWTEIKSLFRKIQTKAISNALGFWVVWIDALEWCRVVINLTRPWIRETEKKPRLQDRDTSQANTISIQLCV